jgi:hypothetical protein
MPTQSETISAASGLHHATVSRRSGVVSCNLNEESVLLDTLSGIYFGLNPVGASIWRLIEVPMSAGEIQTELQKEYDIDAAACEAAVHDFLGRLSAKGLIETQTQ